LSAKKTRKQLNRKRAQRIERYRITKERSRETERERERDR